MCYNILADTYAQHFAPKLYRDVPRSCLEWSARRALLLAEIRYWAPDVVCLQEVQHYQDLELEMRAAGYEGRFMRRTGRRRDGCATFWRVDRLRACSIQRLDFAPLGLEDNLAMLLSLAPLPPPGRSAAGGGPGEEAAAAAAAARNGADGREGDDMDSRVAAALSSVRLLVATTHITFDPAKGDVKLGQVRTLLHRAAALAADPPPEEDLVPRSSSSGGSLHHQSSLYHQGSLHHSRSHQGTQGHHASSRHPHGSQTHGTAAAGAGGQGQGQGQGQPPAASQGHGRHKPGVLPAASSRSRTEDDRHQHQHHRHHQQHHNQQQELQSGLEGGLGGLSLGSELGGSPPGSGSGHRPGGRSKAPLQTLAIITGDFNSTAGSPLYQFVAHGSLDLARTTRKKLSGQLHGVCHTQYKPVSEVKALHAEMAAASAVAAAATAETAAAAAAATAATAGCAEATVTAAVASPPSTPPATPREPPPPPSQPVDVVEAAATAAPQPAAAEMDASAAPSPSGVLSSAPAGVVQCLASAAAAACANAASPAVKAAAATKILDSFLSSVRYGVDRWTDRELRCAMGDQYTGGLPRSYLTGCSSMQHLHVGSEGGSSGATAAAGGCELAGHSGQPRPLRDSMDGAGIGAGVGPGAAQPRRLGRIHSVPASSRCSVDGGAAAGASSCGADFSAFAGRSMDGQSLPPMPEDEEPASTAAAASDLVVRHPLRLRSSYVEVAQAEPAFTSIHSGFMGAVDFIWYTPDSVLQQQQQQQEHKPRSEDASWATQQGRHERASAPLGQRERQQQQEEQEPCMANPAEPRFELVPVAVLQPPDLEGLPRGLPAEGWGSDHISVMTQFELRPVL